MKWWMFWNMYACKCVLSKGTLVKPMFLVFRSVLLMWLVTVAGGVWLMENPMNSLIALHPRYVWMCELLLEFNIYATWLRLLAESVGGKNNTLPQSLPHIIYVLYTCKYSVSSPFAIKGVPRATAQTFKIGFWMRKYNSISWKRTWVWSLSRHISDLDLGPLTAEERAESVATTEKYQDSKGRKRYKGNVNLKRSQ